MLHTPNRPDPDSPPWAGAVYPGDDLTQTGSTAVSGSYTVVLPYRRIRPSACGTSRSCCRSPGIIGWDTGVK